MTENPSSFNPQSFTLTELRRALQDLQNRIAFMRDVVRGNYEPFESPDEWLAGLDDATSHADLIALPFIDRLRAAGMQWNFGGCSYASDAEALIGFSQRIVVGDIHDPLAPLPILDFVDGRLEDPRELRMNRFRTCILLADEFETLAAQVRRTCSLLSVGTSLVAGQMQPETPKGGSISESEWRRSFSLLRGSEITGPKRLWRVLSRLVGEKKTTILKPHESVGWRYQDGKVPSNLYRDRTSLMEHKIADVSILVGVGEPAYSYDLRMPLPTLLLDQLDEDYPIPS
jgi:hypothetical protein